MPHNSSTSKRQILIAAVIGAAVALILFFFLPFGLTASSVTTAAVATVATAVTAAGAAAGGSIRYLLSKSALGALLRRSRRGTVAGVHVSDSDMLKGTIDAGQLGPWQDEDDLMRELKGEVLSESLSCSVFAPPAASPGDAVMVQAYAHAKGSEQTAFLLASIGADPNATHRVTKDFLAKVPHSSRLGFHLFVNGIKVDEPDQQIIWDGAPEAVRFILTIPDDFRPRNVAAKLYVTIGATPIGHVSFILSVVPQEEKRKFMKAAHVERAGTLSRYRKAFISYASEDREEVLPRVQALVAAKIKVFQDILDLEPGERWEQQLYKHIDGCDAFFLFWSGAAKGSKWVLKEALYAFERQGGKDDTPPEIIPIIIEGPPPVEPPPELSFLHFNDKYIYLMVGVEAESDARRKRV